MLIPFQDEVRALLDRLGAGPEDRATLEELMLRAAALAPSTQSTISWDESGPGARVARTPGGTASDMANTLVTAPLPAPATGSLPSTPDERYEDVVPIGSGGMGDVYRVYDRQLHRTVARKVLRAEKSKVPDIVDRFVQEAQTTAQLQHPSIVAVHELGRFPDGRTWFTMKEVRGTTLTQLIHAVHAASRQGMWREAGDGTSFRQLVQVFYEVCMAMAYAHHRGVIHRDLKPENIMVGRYGEVQVMDWGIAKVLDPTGTEPMVLPSKQPTREGRISGTPAYMSPEQAWAKPLVTPRADVYALGAILYEILTGRPPYLGEAREIVRRVRKGEPIPPPGTAPAQRFTETRSYSIDEPLPAAADHRIPPAPQELVAVCMQALAHDPEERQDDAQELAKQVKDWLEGVKRRANAQALVEQAEALLPRIAQLRVDARQVRKAADQAVGSLPRHASQELKEPHWADQDRADELHLEADLVELDREGMLRAALSQAPGLPSAHVALARHYRQLHRAAENAHDRRGAAKAEVLMRAHASALPEDHPERGGLLSYLKGIGRVTLHTERPAYANLFRIVTSARRSLPVFTRRLSLPLEGTRLAMGRYVLVLECDNCPEVRYPVVIDRQGRWLPTAPGEPDRPLALPTTDDIEDDEVFVPPGPYTDPDGQTRWVEGFVMQAHPVRLRDYLAFLNDLAAQGREQDALAHMPQEQHGGVAGVAFTGDGTFKLLPDPDGDLWELDWPVIMVSWADAMAYAAWLSERTGHTWRLPWETEWLKAARGVEGRRFPWGDFGDPSWACTAHSFESGPHPATVDQFPDDISVYGIRHLAGNVVEWCLESSNDPDLRTPASRRTIQPDAEMRALRGGAWTRRLDRCDTLNRTVLRADARMPDVGFRLVRPFTPTTSKETP